MSGTVRAQDIAPYRDSDPALFTGGVKVHSISKALGTEQLQINVLFFEPGARARPHSHEQDQVLYYVTDGIYALDGGEDQPIAAGEFVLLPAGSVHMHGASDSAPASHLSLMRETSSDFDVEVPEAWQRFEA
jgi:quercetin dioxygenase-like cupin family protein